MSRSLMVRRSSLPVLPRAMFDMPMPFFPGWLGRFFETAGAGLPLDVIETADGYEAVLEAAGVKSDSVEVSLEDNLLTIKVRKPAPEAVQGESVHIRERLFGEFTRTVTLPQDADPDTVSAEIANGLLTVRIGKREEAKPRRIEVKTT